LRDGRGTKTQVVAEQHQHFLTIFQPQFDAAEGRRLPVVMAAQRDDFILENVAILRKRQLFQHLLVGIVA
jgi:hypothetical protein